MKIFNLKSNISLVALSMSIVGCAPVLLQPQSQTNQTGASSQNSTNARASQSGSARPQQGANAGARNVPENWQPLGPVLAPGCRGIEVVEYFERRIIGPDKLYFIAIRNNNPAAKIVLVDYRGGVRVNGSRGEGTKNATVAAGEINQIEIDLSHNIPRKIQIARCM